MKGIHLALIAAVSLLGINSYASELPTEQAVLTDAPLVPPLITRTTPAHVIINLETREDT